MLVIHLKKKTHDFYTFQFRSATTPSQEAEELSQAKWIWRLQDFRLNCDEGKFNLTFEKPIILNYFVKSEAFPWPYLHEWVAKRMCCISWKRVAGYLIQTQAPNCFHTSYVSRPIPYFFINLGVPCTFFSVAKAKATFAVVIIHFQLHTIWGGKVYLWKTAIFTANTQFYHCFFVNLACVFDY